MENAKDKVGIRLPWWFMVGVQTIVCSLAMQENALIQLEWGYYVDIPVIKYFFAMFQRMSGWGMDVIFLMTGLACIFCLVREHPQQKNFWIRVLAFLFGIFMVFGKSYYDLGNWNYIFHGRLQFGLACFVILGYYWLFKNAIVLMKWAGDKFSLCRNEPKGKVEILLFERHSFLGQLLATAGCSIPFLICFFPGLLHLDAMEQCWSYLGAYPWTAHHPVGVTWLLGQCMHISRVVVGDDTLAIFLYACPQYIIQWFVFAYGSFVLGKLRAPILLRWFTFIYFSLFPLWKDWGFIVSKDSSFYIFLLLLVELLVHIFQEKQTFWWHWLLLCVCSVGVTQTRYNGIYVLIPLCMVMVILQRKYWKVCIPILSCMLLSNFLVTDIYRVQKDIPDGEVGEKLSVPLQQTARYVKEHYDEISNDEMEVLEQLFSVDMISLGELYNPELSDPVKSHFKGDASSEELQSYFKVWFSQFQRHPDTYIQAFLNQVYGYFYPDRENFWGSIAHYTLLGGRQYWDDGHLSFEFGMDYRELRDLFEKENDIVSRFPLICMIYSAGFHNYILIGCVVYLLAHRKYREGIVLLPSLITVLICLFSPVNAYVRYMLPVMVIMPINISWCYYVVSEERKLDVQ